MTFNWCFIGAGTIAFRVAKHIVTIDGHRIVSIYNRSKNKALKFSKKYYSRVYDSALEAINDPEVDAVYIATSNDTHYDFIKLCLEYQKPVICEKPITANAKQLQALIKLQKQNKTFLCEAMWTWFNPVSLQVKKWIEQNKIGKIMSVKCNFCVPMFGYKNHIRLIEPSKCGGALLDLGVYCVRYMYELFGVPHSVISKAELYNGVDISNRTTFIYDDFQAILSSRFNKYEGDIVVIKGEKGTIKVPTFHRAHKAILKNKKEKHVFKDSNSKFAYQFKKVAEHIKDGKLESDISLKSSLEVMKLLDEIRRENGIVYPYDTINY